MCAGNGARHAGSNGASDEGRSSYEPGTMGANNAGTEQQGTLQTRLGEYGSTVDPAAMHAAAAALQQAGMNPYLFNAQLNSHLAQMQQQVPLTVNHVLLRHT